jgi:hypothetical protein
VGRRLDWAWWFVFPLQLNMGKGSNMEIGHSRKLRCNARGIRENRRRQRRQRMNNTNTHVTER